MWIFLTVVLTLQVHIKVLSYGAIGAFVETASAVCTLSQCFVFFQKLIVCPLKNGNLCRAFLEMSIKDWSEPKQNIKAASVAFVFPI